MDVAHVILHVALCGAVAKAKPETPIQMRVRLADRRRVVSLDKTFRIERGDDNVKIVEFDTAPGTYLMDVEVAKTGCSDASFQYFMAGQSRSIDVPLADVPAPPLLPVLFEGTAPQSFLYAKPTYVLLDKSTACNAPVGAPLPIHLDLENDQDSFYAWLYQDPPYDQPAILALRLKTPTHQYHYLKLPIPYPVPQSGWPSNVHFDVTEDEIGMLASQPVNTLLCVKLFETKIYI